MIPTPDQFLAKLAASPADAAAFDRATQRERPHCRTRHEAIIDTLAAVNATIAETQAIKAKLAASKAKLAALEKAKVTNQRLLASLAAAKQARRTTAKPSGKPTIRQQYNAIATPEGREKFRAANWDALYNSPK